MHCTSTRAGRRAGRTVPAERTRPGAGFSLLELLVALVVIGVLTAIAMPMYQSQAMASKRANGTAALQDAASREEQFFLDNKSYTTTIGAGGLGVSATTEGGHYVLSVDAPAASCLVTQCYVLRATPQNAQAADPCGALTISSDGERLPAGCW